ncbi:MAG: hypothetical protein FWH28_01200 [Clostridiales bacterium]|nr:hypothetical protein [Clostridiales bacterium]
MKKAVFRMIAYMVILVLAMMLTAGSAWASDGDSEDRLEQELLSASGLDKLTVDELYEKVKDSRQTLLETRLEVVKKANEAKLRLEELIKGNKTGAQATETLRKDLDTIREAQRVLATILSDILNAAADINRRVAGEQEGSAGNSTAGEPSAASRVVQAPALIFDTESEESIPSRSYLEKLISLYEEKTRQLIRIAESLDGIVLVG